MNWLDYDFRIHKLDSLLEKVSSNTTIKFLLLSAIHYLVVFYIIFYALFFTNNILIFSISYALLIGQIILNIMDNGCFMMKLERKYIGKWWYGPYVILNYIKEDLINPYTCSLLFRALSVFGFSYGLYRLYKYYIGTDFIQNTHHQSLIQENEQTSEDNIVVDPL